MAETYKEKWGSKEESLNHNSLSPMPSTTRSASQAQETAISSYGKEAQQIREYLHIKEKSVVSSWTKQKEFSTQEDLMAKSSLGGSMAALS